jgi:hypothetical protein
MRDRALLVGVSASLLAAAALLACSAFSADDTTDAGVENEGGAVLESGAAESAPPPGDSSPPPVPPGTTVLASGFDALAGIAATETTVYFTEQGVGQLVAVPLAGGATVVLFNGMGAPSGVAVSNGDVYWCEHSKRLLRRVPVSSPGASPTDNLLQKGPFIIAPTVTGVVVGASSVTDAGTSPGEIDQFTSFNPPIVSAADNPLGVAASAQDIYWTESSIGRIGHAKLGVGASDAFASNEGDCRSIAADAQGVYWTRPSVSKVRAKLVNSSGVIDLAAGEVGPSSLATDPTHVYWVSSLGQIRRIKRTAGATVETVVDGFAPITDIHFQSLALTKDYVVWLTSDGRVLRHAK